MKKFDLNIEQILDNWDIYHAIRELISNAIDEQVLTNTKKIKLYKDDKNFWHIRDYGRGIKYDHLTQNENEEKMEHPNLIGKFGVGLKDALATLYRNNVNVSINSKHSDIEIELSSKSGFDDIVTLHAVINSPSKPEIVGTDIILENCADEQMDKAKALFLIFSGELLVGSTEYGTIHEKNKESSNIYINGVKVAEEENFLFSYNITSITQSIKKALNRERTNVGRSAYTDRIKSILLKTEEDGIAEKLIVDLEELERGYGHEEISWIDVTTHACKLLSSKDKVVFFTPEELKDSPVMVDRAKDDGYRVITVNQKIKNKLKGAEDYSGNKLLDLETFREKWNDSFEFNFIDLSQLTVSEQRIYDSYENILHIIGDMAPKINKILISETMRVDAGSNQETVGLWESNTRRIIIKRDQLNNLESFAGTFLHECAHAISGAPDVSLDFESCLTELLGKVVIPML